MTPASGIVAPSEEESPKRKQRKRIDKKKGRIYTRMLIDMLTLKIKS